MSILPRSTRGPIASSALSCPAPRTAGSPPPPTATTRRDRRRACLANPVHFPRRPAHRPGHLEPESVRCTDRHPAPRDRQAPPVLARTANAVAPVPQGHDPPGTAVKPRRHAEENETAAARGNFSRDDPVPYVQVVRKRFLSTIHFIRSRPEARPDRLQKTRLAQVLPKGRSITRNGPCRVIVARDFLQRYLHAGNASPATPSRTSRHNPSDPTSALQEPALRRPEDSQKSTKDSCHRPPQTQKTLAVSPSAEVAERVPLGYALAGQAIPVWRDSLPDPEPAEMGMSSLGTIPIRHI